MNIPYSHAIEITPESDRPKNTSIQLCAHITVLPYRQFVNKNELDYGARFNRILLYGEQ